MSLQASISNRNLPLPVTSVIAASWQKQANKVARAVLGLHSELFWWVELTGKLIVASHCCTTSSSRENSQGPHRRKRRLHLKLSKQGGRWAKEVTLCASVVVTYSGFLFKSASNLHVIPNIAKFSRPKNFANRFQKGDRNIRAKNIREGGSDTLCNTITWLLCLCGSSDLWWLMNPSQYYSPSCVYSACL